MENKHIFSHCFFIVVCFRNLVKNLERLSLAVKGQRKALIYLPLTATIQAYFIQGRVKIAFSPPS